MPPTLSEILISLNTLLASDIITTIDGCKKTGFTDFLTVVISGGVITGVLQIISDAVGNTRLKEMYKKSQEALILKEQERKELYDKKEDYKDTVYIIRAKVQMFHRQCNKADPCCLLIEELLQTIDQRLPNRTLIPERKDD
jgi:hypothetical protein